jgi:hypothetical protein
MDVPARNPTTPMVNVPRFDLEVQVHMMVIEGFARFDSLQHGFEKQNPPIIEPLENPQMDFHIPYDQGQHQVIMDSMIIKVSTLLFEGFSISMLFTMLLLKNSKMVHGLSIVFMDELFSLL